MSEPTEGTDPKDAADPIKNLKSEFSRKLSNQESKLEELNKSIQNLIATQVKPAPKAEPEEDLSTLAITDPKAYYDKLKNQTKVELKEEFGRMGAAQSKTQAVLASLYSDYPELQSAEAPLTKRAIEIYNSMDSTDQANPLAYKSATLQAAQELAVKPKKARDLDEDFVAPSGGSRKIDRKPRIEQATKDFAEIMQQVTGVDLTSKEAEERLATHAGRNWLKFRQLGKRK